MASRAFYKRESRKFTGSFQVVNMNPLPVLRKQTLNKIRSDLQRTDNEQNKNPTDMKIFKHISSFHLSSKDGENQLPAECTGTQKPSLQHGKSRIPVLAKTLHLQTSEFNQCYTKWEEKPLVRKAKKKRQSTQPVLFNHYRNKTQKAVEIHKPLTASHSKTHAVQSNTCACNAKPSKSQVVLDSKDNSVRDVDKSLGKTAENASQLSGQWRPSKPLKTSATLNNSLSSVFGKTVQNEGTSSSVQFVSGAEVALDNMSLLSLKEPSKSSKPELLTLQDRSSKDLNDKEENIQLDHAALIGFLKNGVTPRSKPYKNVPQRVSVKKSQRKAGPPAGPVRLVQFSPDSTALQSILQNEGVKAGGPLSAMFKDSVCPSNRGTSIYTAQRVLVKKVSAEATGGPVALRQTPLVKPTPQRILNTKHQSVSMKGCQTPYGTPRRCKINIQSCQEQKVVQRLFDDPEDERSTAGPDKDPETQSKRFSVQISSSSSSKEPIDSCKTNSDSNKEEKSSITAQPRESVIIFSTGKKLLRAPHLDLNVSAQQDQLGPVSSNQRNLSGAQSETSTESEPARSSNPSVLPRHRDLSTQKTSSPSSAMLMLRKRFPPLEELLLDDEVSTYTSKSVTAAPGFLHSCSRCVNPLASILHFEESTKFVPIDFVLPLALHDSQLQKR